jgi:hypothetical protein
LCPTDEAAAALEETFVRMASVLGTIAGLFDEIGKMRDAEFRKEEEARIMPMFYTTVINLMEIYPQGRAQFMVDVRAMNLMIRGRVIKKEG